MVPPPANAPGDGDERLRRCIRDLAALTALPSLCIGRRPDEALALLVDALPTALACDFVFVAMPGSPPCMRGQLDGRPLTPDELAQLRTTTAGDDDGADSEVFVAGRKLSCIEVEVPLAAQRGRLLAGRRSGIDAETDRVLIRTAANLVGAAVQSAAVLDSARRKDDFLALLGHELRNPLAPIVTAVELLKENESARRQCEVIERHTHHLVRVVDDLLDISRVTRGNVELRREYVTLASVLQRAVEIAMPLLSRAQHRLDVADPRDATLHGDPVRLAQIFGNLLTNAAKFTPPSGRVEVLIERDPTRVRVIVRDSGCGIPEDQLGRIFEPFVQADRPPHVLRGGLGLGLAIVRSLVERHGGTVWAHSGGRGKGSAFTVELPTVSHVDAAVMAPRDPSSEARAQVKVLVVDDNVDIAELLSEALQRKGFQTAIANDGHTAIVFWRSFLPHAGIFDVGLPDLDGHDVARTVRAEYGSRPILIAMTGYGLPSDREASAAAGFDCHLVKPVSLDEIVRLLDEHISR